MALLHFFPHGIGAVKGRGVSIRPLFILQELLSIIAGTTISLILTQGEKLFSMSWRVSRFKSTPISRHRMGAQPLLEKGDDHAIDQKEKRKRFGNGSDSGKQHGHFQKGQGEKDRKTPGLFHEMLLGRWSPLTGSGGACSPPITP